MGLPDRGIRSRRLRRQRSASPSTSPRVRRSRMARIARAGLRCRMQHNMQSFLTPERTQTAHSHYSQFQVFLSGSWLFLPGRLIRGRRVSLRGVPLRLVASPWRGSRCLWQLSVFQRRESWPLHRLCRAGCVSQRSSPGEPYPDCTVPDQSHSSRHQSSLDPSHAVQGPPPLDSWL